MKMDSITYSIVTTPNPLNPNEQPVGNIILDDRLYDYEIITLIFGSLSYNIEYLDKPVLSNKLEAPGLEWVAGNKVTLQIKKSCNC